MSVERCRTLDRLAADEFGIPSIVLMENAAIGLKTHALEMLCDARSQEIVICCGPGNNAGDGFALARHLHNQGLHPTVITSTRPDALGGDALTNFQIITKMGITIIDARAYLDASDNPAPGLIVDALFGTGLTRGVEGISSALIARINRLHQAGSLVLAVDIPSGFDARLGSPIGEQVVHADRTITFAALKDGFRSIDAQAYLGEVHVVDIGVPRALLETLGTRVQPPQGPEQDANEP